MEWKGKIQTGRRIFVDIYLTNDSYPEYTNNSFILIRKRQPDKKWAKTWMGTSQEVSTWKVSKFESSGKCKLKLQWGASTRMAKIKKLTISSRG